MTPVVNSAFDIANGRNSALLCQRYSHVEDWAPPCSPISTNSTGSLPTTPAPISVPLSDQPLFLEPSSYPPLAADSVQKYAQSHQGYSQYSHYQPYASHISAPQPDCAAKRSGGVPPCFLANGNMEEARGLQTPMAREDLDFTMMFMASLDPSYSL